MALRLITHINGWLHNNVFAASDIVFFFIRISFIQILTLFYLAPSNKLQQAKNYKGQIKYHKIIIVTFWSMFCIQYMSSSSPRINKSAALLIFAIVAACANVLFYIYIDLESSAFNLWQFYFLPFLIILSSYHVETFW